MRDRLADDDEHAGLRANGTEAKLVQEFGRRDLADRVERAGVGPRRAERSGSTRLISPCGPIAIATARPEVLARSPASRSRTTSVIVLATAAI